jgi:hypothetical protein
MANNIVTQFTKVENDKSESIGLQTELVTLDFIHEYIANIKKILIEIDTRDTMSRWNWEYMLTKAGSSMSNYYSRLRFVQQIKSFSQPRIYFLEITPLVNLYDSKENLIEDAINIKVSYLDGTKIFYEGTLGNYVKPEEKE